jgi:hypothetical protein
MTCDSTRNQILALEDPGQLGAEFAGHLAGCESCKHWHRNLLRVEKSIPLIHVPQADPAVKAVLLQTIRTPNLTPSKNHKSASKARPAAASSRLSWGEMVTQYWYVGLIAATLLVGTLAVLNMGGHTQTTARSSPPDPMLEVVVQSNLDLAKARTAEQKIAALKVLADQLHQEMRDICRVDPTGENMEELQKMYQDVVLSGIVMQAQRKLLSGTVKENQDELAKLEDWLSQAGKQAEQLAADVPQSSVGPLKEVAKAAEQGTKRIREEIGGSRLP